MPPLSLEGDTLGQRHRYLNKLVKDAVANNKPPALTKINSDDDDIENLIKIDVAARNKDVGYILEVLKGEDLMYVSRALKRSAWLVTEPQHAHIVNPHHLHQHLFPHMTTKAINKLLLHIKLNLKDEKRVEEFYDYIKDHKPDDALRWLQNCSVAFVENVIKAKTDIPMFFYKRLCKRSFDFLKYYSNVTFSHVKVLTQVTFLIKNHTVEFLDFMDTLEHEYQIPEMDAKATEIIMNKCPHRILNNFVKYARRVDLSIVAKHIKREEIKDFVLKHIKNGELNTLLTSDENFKHFVKYIPQEERHEFVRKVYVAFEAPPPASEDDCVMLCSLQDSCVPSRTNSYRWYQYAPFNEAFNDLKTLIRAESAPAERCAMLGVLVTVSRRNPQHLRTVLQYYRDKHGNEPFKFKTQFINNVVTQIAVHKLHEETWNILDQLFHSVEVYMESDKNVQTCVKSIIVYKICKDQEIPAIIDKKFTFDTFKNFQSRLNQEQKDKLFTYLLNYISNRLRDEKINDESQFKKYIVYLKQALNLLIDWKKDLKDHPLILEKIQQLITIKREHSWNTKLADLYNMNKKWRRHLFSASLSLCVTEVSCLNALKHEPRLLARHSAELHALRATDAAAPRRLLTKLRVYWPHTIAKEWTDEYFKGFNATTGHKALINGLFILLPQKEAVDIAKKYVPEETKINWGHIDQRELSIRKNIAMNLHVTRPQPPLDAVLAYAKGDYLQYAVPSLKAVLHNMSKKHGQEHILKFIDAPVSLQKYGIGFAFDKLESEELRPLFLNIWKTTKNSTIRAMLFTCTHKMLCKVKDPADAQHIWIVLSSFIDNLSNEENKEIYHKLGQVRNIHRSVQAEIFMKSYKFLHSLPAKNNCESLVNKLMDYAPRIMGILDPDFVADHLLASVDEKFCTKNSINHDVLSTFVLHGHSVEEQMRRFDKVLLPVIERVIQSRDDAVEGVYWAKHNFNEFTTNLAWRFRELVTKKQIQVPVKLFAAIKNKFDEELPTCEKYLLTTYWKLAETYAKLVEEHESMLNTEEDISSAMDDQDYYFPSKIEEIWYKIHLQILPLFGSTCLQYLKEDLEKYFPSIYSLFGLALDGIFKNILSRNSRMLMETLKHMLGSEDCIPSYLLVCDRIPTYVSGDEETSKRAEIRQILSSHPAQEVQMHIKAFWDQYRI